jgi:hypothetical protein
MNTSELVSSVDSEIARLQEVRALLAGHNGNIRPGRKPGRKRTMSAAARARIGAATKARWAAGKMGKQSRNRLRKLVAAKKAA